jgi:hypothetical protein
MDFHTEQEYEDARDNFIESDDFKYLRKQAVEDDRTELSFQDWKEEAVEEDTDLVYDSSYRCKWRMDAVLECIDKHEYEET